MTTFELINIFKSKDIEIWADGDRLRYNAPKGALTPDLRKKLAANKSEILALLRQADTVTEYASIPITAVSREGDLPLSFAQQRLWFLDQLEPGSAAYNIPAVLRLYGQINLRALELSFNEIIRRHESLRTTFTTIDGQPLQHISLFLTLKVQVMDLQDCPATDREHEAQRLVNEEAQRPFNLSQGPLLRATLLTLNEEDHVLLLTIHHIVSDGWSMGVLFRELSILYQDFSAGKPSPLTELAIQYADFALWQRQWLQGDVLEKQLAYWRQRLDDAAPALELPTDRPRPTVQTHRGAIESVALSKDLADALRAISRREGVTLFMTLLAAFKILLYRLSGQSDIIVGTPIANRNRTEIEGLIGFFVNTLVMRTDLSGQPTFLELLERVRETSIGAYAHQDMPFERLVEERAPERDLSRTPLFQVFFNYIVTVGDKATGLPGLEHEAVDWLEDRESKFDLSLYVYEGEEGLTGAFEYNTDLFDAERIERMVGQFQTLLKGIVADPWQCICHLPLLNEAERRQLLVEWNDTVVQYPRTVNVHELFEKQVKRTPDAIAVMDINQQITYQEINTRSNQLAHYLKELGVGPQVVVGLCTKRSVKMVIGIMSILKAGGIYLPLDPSYPEQRLAYMIEDSRTLILLSDKDSASTLPKSKARIVYLDSEEQIFAHYSTEDPVSCVEAKTPAYLIYTSGSTGMPKGVIGLQRGLLNRFNWMWKKYPFAAGEACCQKTSISFVDSIWEILGPLLKGIKSVIISDEVVKNPRQFVKCLAEEQITRIIAVPSYLRVMLDAYSDLQKRLPKLKYCVSSGEILSKELYQKFCKKLPQSVLLNLYGSSEVSADVTWYDTSYIDPERLSVPIGRPIANTQVYILDSFLKPVPIGVPGELYIGGENVSGGYLNQRKMTENAFIPNPFSNKSDSLLFKTGDNGCWLPDGNIEFIGRVDHQVKLRGFRIELPEIEAIMSQHGHIDNVAVVMRENRSGDKKLVAYVIPKKDLEYSISDLRTFLSKKLPEYMIPGHFVALEEFPITATGKINRNALPVPLFTNLSRDQGFVKPRTAIEAKIAEIWQELIGIDQISINDNFFEIGGHSLLAVQLFSKLSRLFGIDLPLAALFESPTIEGLAQRVEEFKKTNRIKRIFEIFRRTPTLEITATDKDLYTHLVAIQPHGNRPPFFCMHAVGGNVLNYYAFVDELGSDQPLYGLQSLGLDGVHEPHRDIETMAENYIKEMRQLQPHGPYFVGGGSMGGLIALEIAQQLKQVGEKIALLAMFDTFAPTYFDHKGSKRKKRFSKNWVKDVLPKHIQELKKQSLKGQLAYMYNKISFLTFRFFERYKFFVRFYYRRLHRPLPHWVRYWYVEKKNRTTVLVYSPKMYDGNLTLFSDSRNAGVEEKDMEKGWRKFISGEIKVVGIPAKHSGFIEEPILARKLKTCLDRAQKKTE